MLARAQQNLLWARQRHVNQLRSALREYLPGRCSKPSVQSLGSRDALAPPPSFAPTPAGWCPNSPVARIRGALAPCGPSAQPRGDREQRSSRPSRRHSSCPRNRSAAAYGAATRATIVALLRSVQPSRLEQLEAELVASFEQHPDAEILCSLPGLGLVLGARVLAEFGDDPTRYHDARSRRCYAGTAPVTRASGTKTVVIARTARNRRMAHACYLWAFSALRPSPGARRLLRPPASPKGNSRHQALRALANRLVGVLHGCLSRAGSAVDKPIAWPALAEAAA